MERREPSASAPAAADTEAARRALPELIPFSDDERQRLRDALIHSQSLDEARRKELVTQVERLRETVAGIVKHESTWVSVSKLALPSIAAGETVEPSLSRIQPDPLAKIWRQVGGYLSESIEKVRSGSTDD